MIDATIRAYATRQLAAGLLGFCLASALTFVGYSTARPGGAAVQHPAALTVEGRADVTDGDTIVIEGIKIRLEGIDAPESAQSCRMENGHHWPCGLVATRELTRLIGRSLVRCENKGTDKYDRMLGICFVGTLDVNAEMVRLGAAWAFVKYSQAYVAIEAGAKARKIGVWQSETQAPWDYRATKWQVAEDKAPEGCAIKGNVARNERIYHMPWSPWYEKIRMDGDKGKRWFCSEAEAIAAGWRPAQSR